MLKELIEETQIGFIQAKPSGYFEKFTKYFFGVTDRRERLALCLGLVIFWCNCIKDK